MRKKTFQLHPLTAEESVRTLSILTEQDVSPAMRRVAQELAGIPELLTHRADRVMQLARPSFEALDPNNNSALPAGDQLLQTRSYPKKFQHEIEKILGDLRNQHPPTLQ